MYSFYYVSPQIFDIHELRKDNLDLGMTRFFQSREATSTSSMLDQQREEGVWLASMFPMFLFLVQLSCHGNEILEKKHIAFPTLPLEILFISNLNDDLKLNIRNKDSKFSIRNIYLFWGGFFSHVWNN